MIGNLSQFKSTSPYHPLLAIPARFSPGFGAGFPHLSGSILGGRQGDPKDAVLLGSKADKKALRQVLQRFSKDWGVRNI